MHQFHCLGLVQYICLTVRIRTTLHNLRFGPLLWGMARFPLLYRVRMLDCIKCTSILALASLTIISLGLNIICGEPSCQIVLSKDVVILPTYLGTRTMLLDCL
jgi:hypothetical protein